MQPYTSQLNLAREREINKSLYGVYNFAQILCAYTSEEPELSPWRWLGCTVMNTDVADRSYRGKCSLPTFRLVATTQEP